MACKDKERQAYHRRKHYLANIDEVKRKAAISNKAKNIRNKLYVETYLSTHPCVDCGNTNPIVLDFDHVRGVKRKDISAMKVQAFSLKTLQEEIDKCDVRCSNCHRIITHKRRIQSSEALK
jgi:carbamoylphosphate synthase large subunit